MIVAGEMGTPNGLGQSARAMHHALTRLGVPVWTLDAGLPGGSATRGGLPPGVPPAAALMLHVNAPMLPYALLRLPRGLVRGRRVIGYWAWELPTLPPSWRAGQRFVHEVWAMSHFTAAALAPHLSPHIVLRVVPIPLALSPPCPSALSRGDFGLPAQAVVVLVSFNLASSFARKNPLAAIAAHKAAFGARPDRILLLKIGNPDHFPADMATIRAAAADAANIRIDTRTLPAADTYALTACADIVLSLHRSEGFGLVPAEAMLLGRAVVATGWSGNMEFMDAGSAALVAPNLIPARDARGVFEAPGAMWADPDPLEAAQHLRRLADDAQARDALAQRGRTMATARLGADAVLAGLRGLGLAPQGLADAPPPPRVMFPAL